MKYRPELLYLKSRPKRQNNFLHMKFRPRKCTQFIWSLFFPVQITNFAILRFCDLKSQIAKFATLRFCDSPNPGLHWLKVFKIGWLDKNAMCVVYTIEVYMSVLFTRKISNVWCEKMTIHVNYQLVKQITILQVWSERWFL